MARASHGVHHGAYYWECLIHESVDIRSHIRIGWSTRQGELQAPVGYDKYSFAYRDITGMWGGLYRWYRWGWWYRSGGWYRYLSGIYNR